MYIVPVPKNNVYFTKNLTEGNYNSGVSLLGYYYRDSKISKAPYYPITNFDGMISFLKTNYPTYIESLGELNKTIPQDKLIKSMRDAAAKGYTDYPRPSYFANSIMANTGYSVTAVIGDTAKEIGSDIFDSAVLISRLALVGLIVFVGAYALSQVGGINGVKKFFKSVKG